MTHPGKPWVNDSVRQYPHHSWQLSCHGDKKNRGWQIWTWTIWLWLYRQQRWLNGWNARLAHSESWFQIPEKSTVVTGRASDHNSLLCSGKVSLLTMEQTPRPRTDYELISVPLLTILIVLYIGYVEITPWPVQGISSINKARSLGTQLVLLSEILAERWARNCEKLNPNSGHDGLTLWI